MCYIVCSTGNLYSPTYPHDAVKAIVIVMVYSLSISLSSSLNWLLPDDQVLSIDVFALYWFLFVSILTLYHTLPHLPLLTCVLSAFRLVCCHAKGADDR